MHAPSMQDSLLPPELPTPDERRGIVIQYFQSMYHYVDPCGNPKTVEKAHATLALTPLRKCLTYLSRNIDGPTNQCTDKLFLDHAVLDLRKPNSCWLAHSCRATFTHARKKKSPRVCSGHPSDRSRVPCSTECRCRYARGRM